MPNFPWTLTQLICSKIVSDPNVKNVIQVEKTSRGQLKKSQEENAPESPSESFHFLPGLPTAGMRSLQPTDSPVSSRAGLCVPVCEL